MAAVGHIENVRNSLWITFLAILDQYILIFFYKMAFGCPKITFDLISGHFRSIHNLSDLSEIHFGSHFWPFSINTDFYFIFLQNGSGGHFGCPKITFDLISIHFTSIRNVNYRTRLRYLDD